MAKRVFFSFHYQDVIEFRANVVRNHWMTKKDRGEAGYFDASVWESAKRRGEEALKRLINDAIEGTSNTCILIGSHTHARPWVRYEILKSFRRGNHMFGVHINGIKGKDGNTKNLGLNPFECLGITFSKDGQTATMWEKSGSDWVRYTRIGGTAECSCDVSAAYRGKGFDLGQFCSVFKWNGDKGYENFSTWVK